MREFERPNQFSSAEWRARLELACAYRLFDKLGWHELIYNHITVGVPREEGHFLINPFGLLYREITASSLVKIDIEGNIVGESPYGINPAGFVVHAAVHRHRSDVACVMHTHTTAGMAVACLADGLSAISFPACFFTDRIAYHDFEGITLDADECIRLAQSLGSSNAMILRNHGLLSCGASVADAFAELYHLQRACEVQVAVLSSGARVSTIANDICQRVARQYDETARQGDQNRLLFDAMVRWMTELDPSFQA